MPIQPNLVDMDDCVSDPAFALIGSVSSWLYLSGNFIKEIKKMKNLINEGLKTLETKVRSSKGWRMLFALVLVVSSLFAVAPTQLALADAGGVKGHTFDVTFTKWVTSWPAYYPSMAGVSMAGVVGGDVGNGRYAGKVLSDDLSHPGFWLAHARYEVYGKKHSFIADVHIIENDTTTPARALISGVVTQGWLKGARLTGEYTVMPGCPIATPGNVFGTLCFQGTLHVHVGLGFKQ
jgi:hypothetical protein